MSFAFSAQKATQAAAHILKHYQRRRLSRGQLIKLLYLADRKSLLDRGYPITGDRVVAMDDGPVLSNIYNLIKAEHGEVAQQQIWTACLASKGKGVVLSADPGDSKLSDNDVAVLDSILAEFGKWTFKELSDFTHEFGDYKAVYRPGTSTAIPVDATLKAEGRAQDVAAFVRRSDYDEYFARTFGSMA